MAEIADGTPRAKINWKQAGVGLLIATVASLAAVGANATLSFYQSRAPELVYAAPETIPFNGSDKQLAVYQITITNKGKQSVKNVLCYVEVPGAHIDQSHFDADRSAQITETSSEAGARFNDLEMNPGEKVVASILVSSSTGLPSRPVVSLRASGVMGKEEAGGSPSPGDDSASFLKFLLPAVGLFAILMTLLRVIRKKSMAEATLRPSEERHHGEQREVLSYLFGLNGFVEESERVLSLPQSVSYWAESDRISNRVMSNFQAESAARYKCVLEGLLKYASIASQSEGIISFNIARVAARMGQDNVAQEHLKLAKEKMGKLFDLRMEIDPSLKAIWSSVKP
jgi:hypothetical protein